jgi:hypothetical protein
VDAAIDADVGPALSWCALLPVSPSDTSAKFEECGTLATIWEQNIDVALEETILEVAFKTYPIHHPKLTGSHAFSVDPGSSVFQGTIEPVQSSNVPSIVITAFRNGT